MKCPVDSSDLIMSERGGVEIDYCPQCRGVWLDRGELDKIIDRLASETAGKATPPPQAPAGGITPPPLYNTFDPRYGQESKGRYDERHDRERRYGRPDYDQGYDRRRKKKEGWLGDLFDF
jgi:Zn-finger nucleic acid-binding protein